MPTTTDRPVTVEIVTVTASGIERALACVPSSFLAPRVKSNSTHAKLGTGKHAVIRKVLRGVPIAQALEGEPADVVATCARIDYRRLGGDLRDIRTEEAFAFNVRTREVRRLGRLEHRAYPDLGPGWIFGTEDFGGVRIDGVPCVADVKTGHLDVEAARFNAQTKFFAMCIAILTGAERVETRIAYVSETGAVHIDTWTHDAFDLHGFADELEEMLDRTLGAAKVYAETGRADVAIGEHCRYCDVVPACPANVALVRTMAVETTESLAARIDAMTIEQAGEAWVRAKALGKLADYVVDRIKPMIGMHGFLPLPTGKRVRLTVMQSHNFDKGAAIAMLREKGASDEEIASLTKASSYEKAQEGKDPTALPAPRKTRRIKGAA
jgi:hypothetical protein